MSFPKKDRKIRSINGKTFPEASGSNPLDGAAFAPTVAEALRREFGGTNKAVKAVVSLTGANERAVKNWFAAKNGPSGEHLILLIRHSEEVLEAILLMAGRGELVTAKKMVDARHKLAEMIAFMDEIEVGGLPPPDMPD